MRVLISGGTKTNNIIDALEKKFKSSGVDFMAVPYIEQIPDIYQRGEFFDRAIIIEQCWTHDNPKTTERQIRRKINNFALDIASRNLQNTSFVFLTQEKSQATVVYEESLPIQSDSIIVVKKPVYYVNFFHFLVTAEFSDFPDEIIYKDEPDEIEEPEVEDGEELEREYETGDPELDFDSERSPNRLRIDEGIDSRDIEPDVDTDFDASGDLFGGVWDDSDFDLTPDTEQVGDGQGDLGCLFDDGFEPDQPDLDNNPTEPMDDWGLEESSIVGDLGLEESSIGGDLGQGEQGIDEPWGQDQQGVEETWGQDQQGVDEPWEQDQQGIDEPCGQEEQGVAEQWEPSTPPADDFDIDVPLQRSDDLPDFSGDISNPDMGSDFNDPEFSSPDSEYEGGTGYEPDVYEPDTSYEPEPERQDTSDVPGFDSADYQEPETDVMDANSVFDDRHYEEEQSRRPRINRKALRNDLAKATFDAFASRGNSILVTGCGGCGTSTIAMNLANTICNMGYNVLLVDMDTKHKTQSYISREHYDSLDPDTSAVISAVNSSTGMTAHEAIVRQGYHLLTMGMASDERDPAQSFNADRLSRFANLAKTSENFVIYDVPFDCAATSLNTLLITCDNLVINIDASNWGVVKTMLSICNIEDDDVRDIIFNKGQLLFNRYRGLHKVLGKKVRNAVDITKAMDKHVLELIGEDPGNYFSDMHICGIIHDDPNFEDGWFNNSQYSDTPKGNAMFLEVLKNIVLHT